MRNWLLNAALVVVAFGVFYVPLEAFWRHSLPAFPLILHDQLGRLKPLAQTSKLAAVPQDYSLIVGDSYAEGLGDRLMQVINNGNPSYHAGHALHALSGEDVLSFGYRGGYPSYVLPYQVAKEFNGLQNYIGLDVGHPRRLLFTFMKGMIWR